VIEFSDLVLEKAKRLSDERVVQDKDYPLIWWVEGNSEHPYRVQIGADANGEIWFATCTCPHGLNKGAGETTCYHVAAVLLRLQERETDNDR